MAIERRHAGEFRLRRRRGLARVQRCNPRYRLRTALQSVVGEIPVVVVEGELDVCDDALQTGNGGVSNFWVLSFDSAAEGDGNGVDEKVSCIGEPKVVELLLAQGEEKVQDCGGGGAELVHSIPAEGAIAFENGGAEGYTCKEEARG